MISRLPLSDSFALAWEYDPAFDRDAEDFAHQYEVACETLDWSKLCRPGQTPTLFHFRTIKGMHFSRLVDADVGHMERTVLAFRMALVKVENATDLPPIERKIDPNMAKFGELAGEKLLDYLHGHAMTAGAPGGSIATSLGGMVLNRSFNPSPRS